MKELNYENIQNDLFEAIFQIECWNTNLKINVISEIQEAFEVLRK